jgi:hypothetical protein
MTTDQFKRAFAIADDRSVDLSNEDTSCLEGCGLRDFVPTVATVRQIASLMRWQALYFNGTWYMEELNNIKEYLRRKVTVLD